MVITYRTHLKCTHNMYSIWDWWEHFCSVWIVTSTCASYVTTHNSWQPFEICPMIFSKCSYYMPSGNIYWATSWTNFKCSSKWALWSKCSHWAYSKNILKILLDKFQMAANCYGWLYEAHVEVTIQMPQKCSHQSQIEHMLWVHFKCVLYVITMKLLGSFNQISQCSQHVITGFRPPRPQWIHLSNQSHNPALSHWGQEPIYTQ